MCVCVHVYACLCVARESRVPCMLSMYSATKIDPLVPHHRQMYFGYVTSPQS